MQEAIAPKAAGTSASGTHHRRRSRSSYRCEAKIKRYKYLIAGISSSFLAIVILMLFYISGQSERHQQAKLQLRKLETSLQNFTVELEQARNERDALVQGRIPDLAPMKFDEAIPVGNEYVRNVIFTLVKSGNKNMYEYRLVLSNDSLSVVRPRVEILLFNKLGIQIGNAQVKAVNDTTSVGRATLEPGEVRSYSDNIDILRKGEPEYFLIIVTESEKTSSKTMREHLGDVISP